MPNCCLCSHLDCDRAYLFAHPERELSMDEQARYDEALAERVRGVPAQYITGHQEFWGMDFVVTPAVLIPRPETEHVIETVLRLKAAGEGARPTQALRMVDVGTGSGCIALALAKELPQAERFMRRIFLPLLLRSRAPMPHAFNWMAGYSSMKPICCRDWKRDHSISWFPIRLTLGNRRKTRSSWKFASSSRDWRCLLEPTGLEVISRLIPHARAALKPGGWLVMEISGTIADEVRGLLAGWDDVQMTKDLQGIPRVVSARSAC